MGTITLYACHRVALQLLNVSFVIYFNPCLLEKRLTFIKYYFVKNMFFNEVKIIMNAFLTWYKYKMFSEKVK